MTINWNDIDEQDVAHWLGKVQVTRTVADYHGDRSAYEYAVLCHLARRIAPRTWYEFDEPTMSRLMAEAARELLPRNPKWSQQYRSLFYPGMVDRLRPDAERVAMTVGRAQANKIMERWLAEEAAEQAATGDGLRPSRAGEGVAVASTTRSPREQVEDLSGANRQPQSDPFHLFP